MYLSLSVSIDMCVDAMSLQVDDLAYEELILGHIATYLPISWSYNDKLAIFGLKFDLNFRISPRILIY
jgi:hypothetical protein